MRKSPLNKFSIKGLADYNKGQKLKADYINELGSYCMTCETSGDWRGLELSHIVAKSRGGKTTRENTLLECRVCHELYEKKEKNRPLWQQKRAGII